MLFQFFLTLFNDGHILHLRPERLAVHGWGLVLDYYAGQMVSGDGYGLTCLTLILQSRENSEKNFNQKIDLTGNQTRSCWMRDNDIILRPQRWSAVPVQCSLTSTILMFVQCLLTTDVNETLKMLKSSVWWLKPDFYGLLTYKLCT